MHNIYKGATWLIPIQKKSIPFKKYRIWSWGRSPPPTAPACIDTTWRPAAQAMQTSTEKWEETTVNRISLPVLILGNNAGRKTKAKAERKGARRRQGRVGCGARLAGALSPARGRQCSPRTLCRLPGEAIKGSGFRFAASQAAGQRAQSVRQTRSLVLSAFPTKTKINSLRHRLQ